MSKHIERTGFELSEIEHGDSKPTVVDPEEVQQQADESGLDGLYFVTNKSLRDNVISVLEKGEQDGKFQLVELNEVAERRTTRISEYDDDSTAYEIMVENIDRLTGELRGLEEKEVEEITSNYPVAKPGDVLYLRLRPYRRKVTVVPENTQVRMQNLNLNEEILACSGEICVLKKPEQTELTSFDNSLDWHPEYLQMVLQSDVVLFQLLPSTKGGTRPRVPFDEIMSVKIPYPNREVRETMVNEMTEFQEDLRQLKQKYSNLMGPDIFEGINVSSYDDQETNLIMEGLDENLSALLTEADLLPESFSHDPFDQMS